VPVQLALVIVVPVLLIFVYPADSEGRYPVDDAITSMSTLVGLGIGLIMERSWVRFEVDGVWWQRGVRFLVGLIVVVVAYVVSKLMVPEGLAYGLESVIRFVRYALLGWIAAFLCPWLFVRLRLASQQ
jgi:hypothetical protein